MQLIAAIAAVFAAANAAKKNKPLQAEAAENGG